MGLLFGLILPALLIFAPLAILILLGRRKNRIDRTEFGIVIMGCFLAGLFVPIVATSLSAQGLASNFGPDDPRCVTGVATFIFFGYLVNLIGVPIAGIVLFPPKRLAKK